MKIFLSWSGDLSRRLAQSFKDWLPAVIQAARPYVPSDVERNSSLSGEMANAVQDAEFGILFLTSDNIDSPWLTFEAGSLAKNVGEGRVSPLLFDLASTDLSGPLAQLKASRFTKAEVKALVQSINATVGLDRLEPEVLDSVFEKWWPELYVDVRSALRDKPTQKAEIRSDRDLLEECLQLCRTISSRFRTRVADQFPKSVIANLVHVYEELQIYTEDRGEDVRILRVTQKVGNVLRDLRVRDDITRFESEKAFQDAFEKIMTTSID